MAKPIVDGLERDLEGRASVARLDILSDPGRAVAVKYDVQAVPTFLVFDEDGTLIAREVGIPNRKEIGALVTGSRPQ
jgi:thioredoxin-like negative regulator of GroEL